jgi:lysophospholipase L1-like esterase
MINRKSTMKQHIQFFLFACLAVGIGYAFLVRAVVDVAVETDGPGIVQVYWKGWAKEVYEEKSSDKESVQPGKQTVSLSVANLLFIDKVRLDPGNRPGTFTLSGVTFSQFGFVRLRLSGDKGLAGLVPLHQVEDISLDAGGLHFVATGGDPQFELQVQSVKVILQLVATIAVLALMLQVILYGFAAMSKQALAHSRGERRSVRSFFSYLFLSGLSTLLVFSLSMLVLEYSLRWYYRDVLSTARVTYFFNRSLHKFMAERNVLGYRGKHFDISKKDVFRIVVIGDSFAWGQGVLPYSDRFPELFEKKLQEKYPAARFEVINMGLSGMNLPQHHQFLHFTLKLDPDFVLYQWYINDMEITREGAAFKTPTPGLPLEWHNTAIQHSVIYFLFYELYREIRVASGRQMTYSEYMVDKMKDPESEDSVNADNLLNGLINAFKKEHIPLAIVLFPEFIDLEDYNLEFLHQRVLSVCSEHGIPCLDLTEAYVPYNNRIQDLWANRFDAHPGKLAHRIAAEEIFDAFGATWGRMAADRQVP